MLYSKFHPGKFYKAAAQLLVLLLKDPVWATFRLTFSHHLHHWKVLSRAGCQMTESLYNIVVEKHTVSNKVRLTNIFKQ